MNKILIGYKLNSPGKIYRPLYDYVESFEKREKGLRSQWIVWTDKTASRVMDELVSLVDSNDQIFVIDISSAETERFNMPIAA